MRLQKALQGFQLDLAAKGYSDSTRKDYENCLTKLVNFLENPEVKSIKAADLTRFMAWLVTEYKPVRFSKATHPLSRKTALNHWIAIRSFYNWAESSLSIKRPDTNLQAPEAPAPDVTPFTLEELSELVKYGHLSKEAQPGNRSNFRMENPEGLRNKAILLCLMDTGMRVSELCRLDVEDADLNQAQLTIKGHGTGRKTRGRVVFLGRKARAALWQYMTGREDAQDYEPLFASHAAERLTRSGVQQILIRIGEAAGVQHVYPHRFRHTFAIQYLRNGGDVFTLQRLLGHTSLDMVKRYVAIADVDSRRVHQMASPADHIDAVKA